MSTRMLRHCLVFALVLLVSVAGFGQMRSGKFGVGLAGTASLLQCDYSKTDMKYGGGISLSYSMTEYLGLRSTFLFDQMQFTNGISGEKFNTNVFSGNAYLSLDMMPNSSINPFVLAGVGRAYFDGKGLDGVTDLVGSSFDLHMIAGGGFDIFMNEFISATVMGEYVITGNDWYDGLKAGGASDSYARISLQFRYYFFDEGFVSQMLEALKERYRPKGKK